MKKLIYCAAALATALFAGSCQRELLDPAGEGNTVTYTVTVPEAAATKAIGDGKNVDKVVYAVYRVTGESEDVAKTTLSEDELMYQKEVPVNTENGTAVISLELIKDQDYLVLFWAQVDDAWFNHDNTPDENNTPNYYFGTRGIIYPEGYTPNDDKYAAFSNVDYITVNGSISKKITLTRPFGQLNIATNLPDPKLFTPVITGTKVTVEGAAWHYDVATGKGIAGTLEFDSAAPIGERFTGYEKYLSMNYVFVPDQQATVSVSYEITTESHGTVDNTISNVPVKKNYKTNIVGKLLTSDVDYNVTLEKVWTTPDTNIEVVSVASAEDLQEAINDIQDGAEGNIKLEGNITLSALTAKAAAPTCGLQIPYGKTIVLDLNGLTLSQELSQTAGYSMIINDGELVIIDSKGTGKISYKDAGNGGNYVSNTITNRGTLTIKGGTIENVTSEAAANIGFAYTIDTSIWGEASKVVVNIEGGTIKSIYSPLRLRADSVTKEIVGNISGGDIYGRVDHQMSSSTAGVKATLTITGGKFHSYGIKPNHNIKIFGAGVDTDASGIRLSITGGEFDKGFEIDHGEYVPLGKGFNEQFITGGKFHFDPSANVADGYPVKKEGEYYTIGQFTPVAEIDEVEYGSLRAAVAAVEDGGTITLVANETFTKANRYNNGGYWDGLGYSGDKNFTIDLGGYTIKQDGSLNDYLVWLKNDGTKANTITFKNGTMDAGTTAYCALCTASSHVNKLTVNLENITLINKNSNGSTVKIRAGSVLNVNAGTKIIGKDSYLGIENWNAVVNIYDGAKIYMNGTTSYNGCLVGVGGNGTVNVYGGYGKGVSGGLIAMTSGGTINAKGGEWIANTDGTFANSNKSVLVAQSDKQYNAGAGNAVVNVTGGTYKGGYNCYGNAVGDAQINISGGNFNANPENYLADGSFIIEDEGIYEVYNGIKVSTVEDLKAAIKKEGTIYIVNNITVESDWNYRNDGEFTNPVTIEGLGHTIKFTGKISNPNNNNVFAFTDVAVVKNLTLDLSQATAGSKFGTRAITTKASLLVDGCEFVGNPTDPKGIGIIFGEGSNHSGAMITDMTVSIKNSTFTDWTRRGISDNENANDVKSVVIEGNTCTNAHVYLSAYESITFTGNEMTNSVVNITSYTAASTAKVTAIDNTLDSNQYNVIGSERKIFSIAHVNAQEGFTVNAQ